MVAGLVDADLGGGVYKKRVAMPGRGKSGGARTILGTNFGNRWFYIFGFEKSERSNIDAKELAVLQLLSKALVNMDIEALDRAIEAGELTEICHEKESTA